MKVSELREVCQIFEKYDAGYLLGADHDVIYFYYGDYTISRADLAALEELGCHHDADDGSYYCYP